jgi:hypothetical protein
MRLVNFRRWEVATNKSMLHEVCNDCDPTPNLSEMTPDQRQRALRAGAANPAIVERMHEARIAQRAQVASTRTTSRHKGERIRAWQAAILTPLHEEIKWARVNAEGTKRMQSDMAALTVRHPDYDRKVLRIAAQWEEFFTVYLQVLEDMRRRCRAKLGQRHRTKIAPTQPTPKDADPMTYTFPETLTSLRALHLKCTPFPKRRPFRDPWFLEWDKPKQTQRQPEEEPGADEMDD